VKKKFVFILYVILATLLLLFPIEWVLKTLGFGYREKDEKAQTFLQNGFNKFAADQELIWTLKSNWQGQDGNGVAVRTNSLGFRGREFLNPEDQVNHLKNFDLRIYFLGDSITFGHYIEEERTIAFRLEHNLQEKTGKRVLIMNGSVPGYNTFQQLGQYRRNVKKLSPHLVILGFSLSDITERYTSLISFGGERFFMTGIDTTVALNGFQKKWLLSGLRDAMRRYMKGKARRDERTWVRILWQDPRALELKKAWETNFRELEMLIAATKADGLPFLVVIYPDSEQLPAPQELNIPQRNLAQFFTQQNIPLLDLLKSKKLLHHKPNSLYIDETHFSPLGSDLIAKEIGKWILNLGLLAP